MPAPGSPRRIEWPWLLPVPVLVVGSAGANHELGVGQRLGAAMLGVVGAATILAAFRWPRAAVAAAGLLCGLYFLVGFGEGPIFVVVPLAAGAAAMSVRPRDLLPVAGGALLALALGLLARGVDEGWLDYFWPIVGTSALTGAAMTWGWWASGRAEVRDQQARRAATEERLRMAQELHDGVGHGLAVIAMQAGVALHVLDADSDPDSDKVRASLEAIRDTSRESLDALRAELARMADGAVRRPTSGLAELPALLDRVRAGGLAVTLHNESGEVSDIAGHAAYTVVQEALTNVLRHAGASRAVVTLSRDAGALVVTVTDDGRGAPVQDGGMGLRGMRERVTALGGTLAAEPAAGGFRVVARIPA